MPIRDIVVVVIVIGLAIWSVKRPWIGVMNWTWVSIMNPHKLGWGFAASFPVAAIAAAATLLGLLSTKDRETPFKATAVWWLLAFVLWVTLSWLLGRDRAGQYGEWDTFMKIMLMTFVALSLLSTKLHIIIFAAVSAGSIAILAGKGGIFTLLTGGAHRVWGPPKSFIEGNNEFALATIMAIPLLHFIQLQLKERRQKHAMSFLMAMSAVSAIGSQSRGALLAIVAMSALFWWRSSHKGLIGAMILFGALVMLPLMPDTWWDRMGTIQTYEQDASAMGRINAWAVAIGVAKDNFFGSGMHFLYRDYFALYGTVPGAKALVAHSIYFQILGNHGFVGLFLFFGIWVSTYRLAGRLRQGSKEPDTAWVRDLGGMIQASLVAYAAGGAFLSLPYFDLPYNLVVLAVTAFYWLKRHESGANQALGGRRAN